MPDPWLERAQRVLSDPNLDPSKRAALEAKVQARQSSQAGAGPGGVPLRGAGEPMPEVDWYAQDVAEHERSLQPAAGEKLPTAYRPLNERAVAAPIMFEEDARGDEGWRQAMAQADAEGRPAYRVEKEFPFNPLKPSTWTGESAAVRGALALGAFGSGVDKSLTLGAGQRMLADTSGISGARESLNEAAENSPVLHGGGRLAGAIPGYGAAGLIGKGSNALAGVSTTGRLLPGMARAGLGGMIGGAAQAGGEAAIAGEDVGRAMGMGGTAGLILGPFANLLSRGGNAAQRSLRDTDTAPGRDLVRAEAAGAKAGGWAGIRPSPAMKQLSEEGRAAGGYSSEAMAVRKAAPLLGEELNAQQGAALGGARAGNEAIYAQGAQTSAAPVLSKALGVIRSATHSDGTLLPAVNVRGVAKVVERSANVRVVSRTDPAVAAAGENTMDVGLARKLGLISRGTQTGDGEMVVLLEPKMMTAENMDVMTRAFDDTGAVGSGVDKVKARPFRGLGAAAREAREGLGPDVAAAKAQQAEQFNDIGNAMEAAGLPRKTEGIDLNDVGTRNALEGGVRRFRTDTNLANDVELERVAANNPQLREALDLAAGTGAMQRVKDSASMRLAVGQGGAGLPAAAWQGVRLRLDPIMGALGNIPQGVVPATSTELARQLRRR